jgi:hypothetical protein
VFVGTTNKELYLRDETGNRRFWPVKTGDIKLDALRDDRDQLFAEAVHLYLDVLHEPKRTSVPQIAVNALEYELERLTPKDKDEPQPVRGTPINRLSPNDQRRITAVLTHLGWVPKRDMRERWWEHLMLAIVAFKSRSKSLRGQLGKMPGGRLLISGSQVRVLVRPPIKSSTYKTGGRSIFPPFETGKDIGRQCRVRVLLLLWSSGRRHLRHMASHVRRVVGSSD